MPDVSGVLVFFLVFLLPGYLGLSLFRIIAGSGPSGEVSQWALSYGISIVSFLMTSAAADRTGCTVNLAVGDAELPKMLYDPLFAERMALMFGASLIACATLGVLYSLAAGAIRKVRRKGSPGRHRSVWNRAFDYDKAPPVMVEMDDGTIYMGHKVSASARDDQRELLLNNVARYQKVAPDGKQTQMVQVPWGVERLLIDVSKATAVHFLKPEDESKEA